MGGIARPNEVLVVEHGRRAASGGGSGMRSRCLPAALSLAASLALGGCTTLGPDFERPEAAVPDQWLEPDKPKEKPVEAALEAEQREEVSDEAATMAYADWWTVFDDPVLNELIEFCKRPSDRPLEPVTPRDVCHVWTSVASSKLSVSR